MSASKDSIRSAFWNEQAESDNAFAARVCRLAGYDVYGEVLRKASWAEYWYLLFRGERAAPNQARVLESLSIAVANPGPRDASVSGAMNAGVGGSTRAAALMAALAAGAGQHGGAHELALCMEHWAECAMRLDTWLALLAQPRADDRLDIWLPMEHAPGFDPHGASCTLPVLQTLEYLGALAGDAGELAWLTRNRLALEQAAGAPLAMVGVAAAALHQLGFSPAQGEMLYLILRLPGAAAHALEQERYGLKHYPFFRDALHVLNDPGAPQHAAPPPAHADHNHKEVQ